MVTCGLCSYQWQYISPACNFTVNQCLAEFVCWFSILIRLVFFHSVVKLILPLTQVYLTCGSYLRNNAGTISRVSTLAHTRHIIIVY